MVTDVLPLKLVGPRVTVAADGPVVAEGAGAVVVPVTLGGRSVAGRFLRAVSTVLRSAGLRAESNLKTIRPSCCLPPMGAEYSVSTLVALGSLSLASPRRFTTSVSRLEIGRASCRERVSISGVAVSGKEIDVVMR